MAKLQTNSALPDVLENRYALEHVGGAFDAKNLSAPHTVDQALKAATFGRNVNESLMLKGQDTRRYIKHDEIVPVVKKQGVSFLPTNYSIGTIRPKPLTRPSRPVAMASPGQFKREKIFLPGVVPQPLVRPSTSPAPAVVPGQSKGFVARRPEPGGSGRPGTPVPRPFRPTPPQPFGHIIDITRPIYWDTDPDIWDITKLVGQVYWNH